MYRVYLDWNILTQIKNKSTDPLILEIKNIIQNNQSNILIPYSPAHVQDLEKGNKNGQNQELIKSDLDFLDQISKKNCIQYDILQQITKPFIGSSHVIYEGNVKNNEFDFLNPNTFDELEIPKFGKQLRKQWKKTPLNIPFEKFLEHPDASKIFTTYFKRTLKDRNLYNLMLDFSEFYSELKNNPIIYKSITSIFREQASIDPKVISNLEKPFEELPDIINQASLGFDFNDLFTLKTEDNNPVINNFFTKFSMEYASLDIVGYHPDKFTKKNLYSNFTNDMQHSFYAAHCDYFVSFDKKKLLPKSKALYDKYKIETKAMQPEDFVIDIKKKLIEQNTATELFDSITNCLHERTCFISEIKNHDYKNSQVYLFKPQVPILSYFNFLYLKNDSYHRKTIMFRHVSKNFSRFTFYYEFEMVIQKFINLFGVDLADKSYFNQKDKKEISERKWTGRIWIIKDFLYELISDELETGMQFIIEQITDDFINDLKTQ